MYVRTKVCTYVPTATTCHNYPPSPEVKLFTNAPSSNLFVPSSYIFLFLFCVHSVLYAIFKFILPQI